MPCHEIFGGRDSLCPRYAQAEVGRRTEKAVSAIGHRITFRGTQGTLDERSEGRIESVERMQLRHHPIVAGYDDIRPAVVQSAPNAGEREYPAVLVYTVNSRDMGQGVFRGAQGAHSTTQPVQRRAQSRRQRPPLGRYQHDRRLTIQCDTTLIPVIGRSRLAGPILGGHCDLP
jgi:hypothetical protein